MKITYDPKADAMYIYLVTGKKSTRTKEVTDCILVDFSGEQVIGIEILDTSKVTDFDPKNPEASISWQVYT